MSEHILKKQETDDKYLNTFYFMVFSNKKGEMYMMFLPLLYGIIVGVVLAVIASMLKKKGTLKQQLSFTR